MFIGTPQTRRHDNRAYHFHIITNEFVVIYLLLILMNKMYSCKCEPISNTSKNYIYIHVIEFVEYKASCLTTLNIQTKLRLLVIMFNINKLIVLRFYNVPLLW